MSTNDHVIQVLSLESLNKPMTKLNSNIGGKRSLTKNSCVISNSSITTATTDKVFSSTTHSPKVCRVKFI